MKKSKFSQYIKSFDFKELFIDLGWDNFNNKLAVAVNDVAFELTGVVEKKGFVILHCPPMPDGKIPLSNVRKQIEKKVTKNYFEHLIIYSDNDKTQQIWQFVIKEQNKPKQVREIHWYSHQDVEILYQRLKNLLFTIDEEENITLIDVKTRISQNFATNTEKVTKKFYTEFKKQHTIFLDFISGIDDHIANNDNKNKQWYASLMLNRLMFCYFIQKKGFLNQDTNYLQNKLLESKQFEGKNNFYSFYRSFLLELFHDGLGKPETQRHKHPVDLGKIPYLNGGLFDVHELEKQFEEIDISDEAFENLFDFFDKWNWHLDNSIEATGRDINPDVIGYIFEKYINDRAAMGAYYTKEDITDYIGKNTIIPFLFDETERHYKKAFTNTSELWTFLKHSGDTYIYDAVKKGIPQDGGLFDDLPGEIKAGFKPELEKQIVKEDTKPHLWEIRKVWNKKAPEDIALPTEIYRELIERRKRYAEIKAKIDKGEITHTNDFITYNLNIRQFAQDFVENTKDADFIRHFYKAIKKITILDPTAGSGAFLFAAMNILEPLYEACIMRMEQFVAEEPKKHKFFEEVLQEINAPQHPNLKYYIFKNIILNNLYGVDIMKEAVEIAKLRLFLKLVATVDVNARKPNFGLEPLPDIDFNVRAGNTLVGFATEKDLLDTITKSEPLFAQEKLDEFKEEFELVSKAYKRFQNAQLITDQGSEKFKQAKAELNKRLKQLNRKLNIYLASNYGITDPDGKQKKAYQNWLENHQPFHWFAEFYDIVYGNGGFDVIIGNPPYVEYPSKVNYKLINYVTIKCGNLYAFTLEKNYLLSHNNSTIGQIIPVSIISTQGYSSLRILYSNIGLSVISSFNIHPSRLFEGANPRLAIYLVNRNSKKKLFTSKYYKWFADERDTLFNLLAYTKIDNEILNDFQEFGYPKIQNLLSYHVFKKIISVKKRIKDFILPLKIKSNTISFFYRRAFGAFILFYNKIPKMFDDKNIKMIPTELKEIKFDKKYEDVILPIYHSSLFYLNTYISSDCRNINKPEIENLHINLSEIVSDVKLKKLSILLNKSLQNNSKMMDYNYSTGRRKFQAFFPRFSKPIIDQIDTILAQHYGFTEEELDFIINYDIKYRMGKELEAYINGTLGKTEENIKPTL